MTGWANGGILVPRVANKKSIDSLPPRVFSERRKSQAEPGSSAFPFHFFDRMQPWFNLDPTAHGANRGLHENTISFSQAFQQDTDARNRRWGLADILPTDSSDVNSPAGLPK
jgi:hypothetical protein